MARASAWSAYQADSKLAESASTLSHEAAQLRRPASTIRLGPIAVVLKALGFVREYASENVRELGPGDLTLKGTLVSGIAEWVYVSTHDEMSIGRMLLSTRSRQIVMVQFIRICTAIIFAVISLVNHYRPTQCQPHHYHHP